MNTPATSMEGIGGVTFAPEGPDTFVAQKVDISAVYKVVAKKFNIQTLVWGSAQHS